MFQGIVLCHVLVASISHVHVETLSELERFPLELKFDCNEVEDFASEQQVLIFGL